MLQPGQQLVSKDGDLWRWDGYKHSAEADTPVHQMLQNKKNLEKINSLLNNLNKDFNKINNEKINIENNIIKKEKENEGFIAKINDLRTDQDKYQQSYSINLEKSSENKTQLTILKDSQKEYDRINSQLKIIDGRSININNNLNIHNDKLLDYKKKPNDLKLKQIQITKEIEKYKSIIKKY